MLLYFFCLFFSFLLYPSFVFSCLLLELYHRNIFFSTIYYYIFWFIIWICCCYLKFKYYLPFPSFQNFICIFSFVFGIFSAVSIPVILSSVASIVPAFSTVTIYVATAPGCCKFTSFLSYFLNVNLGFSFILTFPFIVIITIFNFFYVLL